MKMNICIFRIALGWRTFFEIAVYCCDHYVLNLGRIDVLMGNYPVLI